jgi:hypothetical protein
VNPILKLTLFALVLLAVFAGGLAVGNAAGPFDDGGTPAPAHAGHAP